MKQVLILENSTDGMRLKESVETAKGKEYILGGLFTEFDVKNRNERIYTAEKFLPHMEELKQRITSKPGIVYGEFDHPENFDTSLARVSHRINNIEFMAEKNCVMGEIRLLNTQMGREAKALVDDDCQIFVSSRAAGVTESTGVVTIKKLFTYDIVADPGFGSAKMELKNLNESLGYSPKANFRIFEVTDESKINKLFEMNKDEMVTKAMLNDYSNYIKEELMKFELMIKNSVSSTTGTPDFEKMQKMIENYESLLETQEKVSKYLDYVAENFSVIVNENKELKTTTEKLIRHNDYLAENLEKSINYSKYMAQKLDKAIDFTDYIVENLEKSINFGNYLAEGMNKLVEYSNYISENLNKTIDFADYLSENLDASIAFSDYIAENLNHSIDFSDYIVENLEGAIEWADYIAENTADTQNYTKYIAEGLDKHVGWSTMLAEKLNAKRLNENAEEEVIDMPSKYMMLDEEEEEEENAAITDEPVVEPAAIDTPAIADEPVVEPVATEEPMVEPVVEPIATEEPMVEPVASTDNMVEPVATEEPTAEPIVSTEPTAEPVSVEPVATEEPVVEPVATITFLVDMPVKIEGTTQTGRVLSVTEDGILVELTDSGEQVLKNSNELAPLEAEVSMESLSESIQKLILESKKRKASEEATPHFFAFLNENEIASFKLLTQDEREKVIVAINESDGYFCKTDVLKIMHKALAVEGETIEERLLRSLPEDIKPIFEAKSDEFKRSILAQAKFYNLDSDDKVVHFWRTRKIEDESLNESKKQIATFNFIETNEFSEKEIESFKKRFENLK